MQMHKGLLIILMFILLCSGLVSGQTPVIISIRVGEVIDKHENEHYDLFPGAESFHSASFFSEPDGRVRLEIFTVRNENDDLQKIVSYPSKTELIRLRDKINKADYMDEASNSTIDSETDSLRFAMMDSLVTAELVDGSILKGHVLSEDNDLIRFRTLGGLDIDIPVSMINKISRIGGKVKEGKFYRFDPNYSRLLFSPTGRPLEKGEGYFSDYYVFFPGISYGLTNYFSFMAGFSLIPGLNFSEQLMYVAPRFAVNLNNRMSVSAGALYGSGGEGFAAGLGFLVGTYGERDYSFTAGLGLGYTKDEDNRFRFARHPIVVFGGNIRLSNSVALISENWIITGSGLTIGNQPFALALRFFGDHISVDAGLILIGEVISEGFPVPWLSFVYNFGK